MPNRSVVARSTSEIGIVPTGSRRISKAAITIAATGNARIAERAGLNAVSLAAQLTVIGTKPAVVVSLPFNLALRSIRAFLQAHGRVTARERGYDPLDARRSTHFISCRNRSVSIFFTVFQSGLP